ncbi:5-methylcytosine-specific restriction enzyme subunit McrC [Novipirellula aureliae]|uniref:5-methylcytosine-specific restriction enzyme subunit McrC n=1 Tax=Novipirellula aureliae TaxID=2527966 RepID=A0A5C6DTJ7_9BACT|nr:restriction endonuclease [Novipirellula aureliae]TWU40002.1 5-methylcytosine-specific restriction enzyme subunit McrC [Novipirellula aureliae]
MTIAAHSIVLSEWETASPETHECLRGFFLDSGSSAFAAAETLTRSRRLELNELRNGLEIKALSHVGRLRLGGLTVTIMPKLPGASLLNLLRYAYGFRKLHLLFDANHLAEPCGFEDLLVAQLNTEAQELLSRGLQRAYVRRGERLASPRGQIDIGWIAREGGLMTAELPCCHYPRIEDTLFNQVLHGGLRLAGSLASNLDLRRDSRRLASLMEESVSSIRLNSTTMNQVARQSNRLTRSYTAALSIIRLLVESEGITLEGKAISNRLPGFLFDMNAFFQALMSRFLAEHLSDHRVVDEQGLKNMMRYNPDFNPQRKQSPTPRPDYAVTKDGHLCAILDAKYRDLWDKPLPREMLYQLVVYAISQRANPTSSIIYPAANLHAKEARIDVSDPIRGSTLGRVCLRPVNLKQIEQMLSVDNPQSRDERRIEAHRMAFGDQ